MVYAQQDQQDNSQQISRHRPSLTVTEHEIMVMAMASQTGLDDLECVGTQWLDGFCWTWKLDLVKKMGGEICEIWGFRHGRTKN
jgi:hypothetical protein